MSAWVLSDSHGRDGPWELFLAALKMIKMQGGVFGAVADSQAFHGGHRMTTTDIITVEAEPYTFEFSPATCALLIIDMQRDFLEQGGFGEMLGNDVSLLRCTIEPRIKDCSLPGAPKVGR